jgi:catechol 2,3-dioxygenase-like lactoylglutathione lyase family enzyme
MENVMGQARKARAVGFNHIALEVGDIEEALAFYGQLFEFKLRGKSGTSAFIDLGEGTERAARHGIDASLQERTSD